ncbi:hypothetical protein IPZ68_32320 [Streptomyces arenae]|nr:hypothetical protein [Streptomyces arenae]
MRDFFVDDMLLITPLHDMTGVRLYGEALGTHKGPLAAAVTQHSRSAQQITVDLTRITYFSNGVLAILVALARNVTPPQQLHVLAHPGLHLQERIASHGWDRITTLQITTTGQDLLPHGN